MTVEDRVAALEEKVKKTEGKDFWDVISAIGSLLIPVAIFAVGLVYSNRSAAANEEIARINAEVQQAQLLLQAVAPLAGADDRQKRLLAIRAVQIALRERGRAIIEEVSRTDPDPQVRTAAAVVNDPAILQLYSADSQERIAGYNRLVATRGADPGLPPLLMEVARNALQDPTTPGRENGIYNTLVLLSHLNRAALAPHGRELRSFADQMRPVGPRINERADILVGRLP